MDIKKKGYHKKLHLCYLIYLTFILLENFVTMYVDNGKNLISAKNGKTHQCPQ